MTARSTTRPLVCVALVLCLCASIFTFGAPASGREPVTELRAISAPSSTVLLTRDAVRHDHARQRPSGPSCFTLVPLGGAASDAGRFAAAVEGPHPRSLWIAPTRAGRSPPAPIS